jgi:hemolysin III
MEVTREEEYWNALTHFIGLIGSIVGVFFLFSYNNNLTSLSNVGIILFGFGLISVYLSSTLYHYVSEPILKEKLRIFDHISIYYLIAGSYAPVCLITLLNMSGLYIFAVVSVIALFGTFFKLFYTGRFEKLSLILYLFMGWLVIIDAKTLYDIIEFNGFLLLILGGASYSIGTIFYSINRKYAHTVWHLFVLAGSILHFFFILYYII